MFGIYKRRLRGETAQFDILDNKGKVVVETGRISARHTRALEKAKITELEVPAEYLVGRVFARGSCRTYETSMPTNAPWHPITSVTFLIHTTLSPWLLTYPRRSR